MAHYMRQVLVNPLSGYYMKGDVFGAEGDFVTSPEISQMFGELAGIWYLTEWHRLGKPSKTQLVEFGPGRGTLMDDMLRALSRFPEMYQTIQGVQFVEASPGLRKVQRAKLIPGSQETDVKQVMDSRNIPVQQCVRSDGISINWYDGIEDLPEAWTMIMAHEFFDALAIHTFEKTDEGWREMLVDFDDTSETWVLLPAKQSDSEYNFRLVRCPQETNASKTLTQDDMIKNYKTGDRIEVSPDSWDTMRKMAEMLDRNGGVGLAIDYGQDRAQGYTLRAIRQHKIVHPMSDPGSADLSADVDFLALKNAAKPVPSISTYGPVTQGHFLRSLGIETRLKMLLQGAKSSERALDMIKSYERLVNPKQMGDIYKVLAFSNDKDFRNTALPVAFEGSSAVQP
ncbi:S-adenosyl-L-methionine-dependent methyltransferase [Umbelopsis sp. PMI_123]|nr:S-adenosyl-L-methionine-dependent methyltransferase [Umbelopsis sp. PMI_123]